MTIDPHIERTTLGIDYASGHAYAFLMEPNRRSMKSPAIPV